MGIYISGMKMPNGRPICIVIDAAGQARRYDLHNDRYADDKLFEAISVPPHGRLGDLDLLTKVLKAKAKNPLNQETVPYSWAFAYECLADAVGDMPTIIPADKEGE